MGLHYNWKYTSHDLENYSLVKYETLLYLQVTYMVYHLVYAPKMPKLKHNKSPCMFRIFSSVDFNSTFKQQ